MKKLAQAPNLAIATLWADMLNSAGLQVSVQRAYASISSMVGRTDELRRDAIRRLADLQS